MVTAANRRRALTRQVRRLEPRLARLRRTSARLAWLRLAVFGGGVLAIGGAFVAGHERLFWTSLVVSIVVFALVVRSHRRLDEGIARHEAWLGIKRAQIARAALDWDALPPADARRRRADHPFEGDLDLVGDRSLHRLLDRTVTREGSGRLRAWLAERDPDRDAVMARQRVVRELVERPLFRDKLTLSAVRATGGGEKWSSERLRTWLERRAPAEPLRRWLVPLSALAAINAALFAANQWAGQPPYWRATFPLYVLLFLVASRGTGDLFAEAMALGDAVAQLVRIFGRLEADRYHGAPHLAALCAPFRDPEDCPSRHMRRVAREVAAVGVRGNWAVWAGLNAVVPWDIFFAYRLYRHRAELARRVPEWLDVWFELEALGALANLAYLNPGYTFPDVPPSAGEGPVFAARGLGHPLIPAEERVCNDFAIEGLGDVALVTGSNMAGKSTWLKTVGVNAALALAGGPVCADALQTVPFRLFTCIRITDSVTDGISYFYAEVRRLRDLLAALDRDHRFPVLFLIDEIFRGTNNRERLIGSRAYIRALAERRGVGLIATHDLELVALADEIPAISNHHFRDDVSDGRMVFDYALRPGPCPTTNALKIMRLAGLPGDDARP